MTRNFKGVWIPKEVWLDTELSVNEKLFLVEIDSLDNDKGCFASNKYFAQFFKLSKGRCSQIITSLEEKKYIEIEFERKGLEVVKRLIRVVNKLKTPIKNIKGGYLENAEDNNTITNNILINNREAEFKNSLQPFLETYGNDMLNDFYSYWTEKKPKGKKMLFEMQKTFDVKRRLERWKRNESKFNTPDKNNNLTAVQKLNLKLGINE